MHATRKLWIWLAAICVLSFAVLGWVGTDIYVKAPPIPQQVVSARGEVLFSGEQIQHGQEAGFPPGGQHWVRCGGHGSISPRLVCGLAATVSGAALREIWAQRDYGKSFERLDIGQQAQLNGLLKAEMRHNSHDAKTGT